MQGPHNDVQLYRGMLKEEYMYIDNKYQAMFSVMPT